MLLGEAFTDVLPRAGTLDVKTVRPDPLKGAARGAAALGEEPWRVSEGCPRDGGHSPIPDGPITVSIAGGDVRDWEAQQHPFEVVVGKRPLAFTRAEADPTPASKRCGVVQTRDAHPNRRLFAVLPSQGLQLNPQMTFLSDGRDPVRDLQRSMSPAAEHRLDWHHVPRPLPVLDH